MPILHRAQLPAFVFSLTRYSLPVYSVRKCTTYYTLTGDLSP